MASLCAAMLLIAACGSQHHQQPSPRPQFQPRVDLRGRRPAASGSGGDARPAPAPRRRARPRLSALGASRSRPAVSAPPRPLRPERPRGLPRGVLAGYDAIVREAAQRGIGLDFTLGERPLSGRRAAARPRGARSGSVEAVGSRVRRVRARGRDALQRQLQAAGRLDAATARQTSGRSGTSRTTARISRRRRRHRPTSRSHRRCTAAWSTRPGARCRPPATAATRS